MPGRLIVPWTIIYWKLDDRSLKNMIREEKRNFIPQQAPRAQHLGFRGLPSPKDYFTSTPCRNFEEYTNTNKQIIPFKRDYVLGLPLPWWSLRVTGWSLRGGPTHQGALVAPKPSRARPRLRFPNVVLVARDYGLRRVFDRLPLINVRLEHSCKLHHIHNYKL